MLEKGPTAHRVEFHLDGSTCGNSARGTALNDSTHTSRGAALHDLLHTKIGDTGAALGAAEPRRRTVPRSHGRTPLYFSEPSLDP